MNWYYDRKKTIETDQGIKARSKRGDFTKNWWAKRWIEAMEQVMDRGRLSRGKTYARKGQVLSLDLKGGKISAKVQGSRGAPYKATIEVTPLNESQWGKVIDALAERPIFMAQLLGGEMPQEIEEAFAAAGASLFPDDASALKTSCSCPDWSEVCKHLAAVHFILAERFDEDPFLLFQLRGKGKDELLDALRALQGDEEAAETGVRAMRETSPSYGSSPTEAGPPLDEQLGTFWQMGEELDGFRTQIKPPSTPLPALERLGEPEFMETSLSELLRPVYDTISAEAVAIANTYSAEEAHEAGDAEI